MLDQGRHTQIRKKPLLYTLITQLTVSFSVMLNKNDYFTPNMFDALLNNNIVNRLSSQIH